MKYQKSLKIILRVENVLSRKQPPRYLYSTYIPVGGEGGIPVMLVYYISLYYYLCWPRPTLAC
jgi:hypothetical protein